METSTNLNHANKDPLSPTTANVLGMITDFEAREIIKDCKRTQRSNPYVDISSHGFPNVASHLVKQGIFKPEQREETLNLISKLKQLCHKDSNTEKRRLRFIFINATEQGGGVAEMRPNNSRFMDEFDIDADWVVIDGSDLFYQTTVHIHEGIQNPDYSPLTQKDYEILQLIMAINFARYVSLNMFDNCDAIQIDDPQPLGLIPLIRAIYSHIPVIQRCHIHCDPEPSIREYIASIVEGRFNAHRDSIIRQFMQKRFDIDLSKLRPEQLRAHAAVFHRKEFSEGLKLNQESVPVYIMGPAINPISFKNMPLSQEFICSTLKRYGVMKDDEKDEISELPPIVLEVSRFDPYKGPFEILVAFIEAMKMLYNNHQDAVSQSKLDYLLRNTRFVYAASTPGDNPSGIRLYEMIQNFLKDLSPSVYCGTFTETEKNCGENNGKEDEISLSGDSNSSINGNEEKEIDSKHPLYDLKERIFLLTLRDLRRTEVLQKFLVDKTKELAIYDLCVRHKSPPLEQLIRELASHKDPKISKDMVAFLRKEGELLISKDACAYFTDKQTQTLANLVADTDFLDDKVKEKVLSRNLSGQEINHLEVNALQTASLVRCQFSSKEGFGLVVAEAMIKEEVCKPPVYGVTIATTVGGVKSQALPDITLPIEYDDNDVQTSLQMYREMKESEMHNAMIIKERYKEISQRVTVQKFAKQICRVLIMYDDKREGRSLQARQHILDNYTIGSNVLNILRTIFSVVERNFVLTK